MKDSHKTSQKTGRQDGMALVLVLSFLVLITALILAFYFSVTTELQGATSYSAGVRSKNLADTAVQVVMGTIRTATSRGTPASPVAWASQPGMIRTYGKSSNETTSTVASPLAYYKLYSSDNMVVTYKQITGDIPESGTTGPFEPGNNVDEQWNLKPALFTDLNSPVIDPEGKPRFPVIDPRVQSSPGVSMVEGFSYSDTVTLTGGGSVKVGQVNLGGSDPNQQRLPMPVNWIYQLKDGTLTAPTGVDAATGKVADWSGLSASTKYKAPSKDNPIVGRIAFWTDDESCKLNINTSSEPTPWDTPRAVTSHDLSYGNFQPGPKEFQRFPGHPFMTALSPVFFPNVSSLTIKQKEAIYDLIPRVQWGGTKAATVPRTDPALKPVTPDTDRLFASVDEFAFQASTPDDARPPNTLITPAMIQKARFFLTANSRASEANLFGQPRLSLWPVNTDATKRTVFDKLAAFCGTIGSGTSAKEYFFQRSDSTSPTADWTGIARNQKLYSYLQTLTNKMVPGFGVKSFKDKWGDDRDQILTEIFDYIRCVNSRDMMPEATNYRYAQNLAGAGSGQITPIQIGTTQGFGRFYSISQAGIHFICSHEEDLGALTYLPPKPAGKPQPPRAYATLAPNERVVAAAFIFEPWSPALGYPVLGEYLYFDIKFDPSTPFTLNGQDLKMTSGSNGLNNSIGFNVFSGVNVFNRTHGGTAGIRIAQALGGANYAWKSDADVTHTWPTSPPQVITIKGVKITGDTMVFSGGNVTINIYYGASADPTKLVQTINLKIPGGTFPVPKLVRQKTESWARAGGAPQQTDPWFWWTFNTTPQTAQTRHTQQIHYNPHVPGLEYVDPERRWVGFGGDPAWKTGWKRASVFRDEDVVRTVVPLHGDIRLIAAKKVVPASDFVKVREALWESPSDRMLHIFDNPGGSYLTYGHCNEPNHSLSGTTVTSSSHRPGGDDRFVVSGDPKSGTLGGIPAANPDDQLTGSPLVKYHWSRLPEIRPGAGKMFNHWNDYDNGVSVRQDGAYINKPDEGNYIKKLATDVYFDYYSLGQLGPGGTDNGVAALNFSPNRLVPSAGMLGSLPTGVMRTRPWETLLFRPEIRAAATNPHPGTQSPKDHLLMDLFWMPVIDPYAISEPFSTAGKVNLNYQIAPFTYIRRATALHGVLKGEEPLIIMNSAATYAKLWDNSVNDAGPTWIPKRPPPIMPDDPLTQDPEVRAEWGKLSTGQAPYDKMRRAIDPVQTLAQADARFASGEIFRSATEICELHLVRIEEKLEDYQSGKIWEEALATGENTRERPYANLYSRLTTKSNTYTVHYRVQVLRKSRSTDATVWDEDKDTVTSEDRGSSLIERYVDVSNNTLPDFAVPGAPTLDTYYKFRILSTKRF